MYTNDAALSEQPMMASLVPVAADDDRGGFYTSQAEFNAVAGVEYLLAVDGFSARTGNIVLSWDLDTNTAPFPRITSQPVSQTVTNGQTARLSVEVLNPESVSYQWVFACQPIEGATHASLVISNVQPADVGLYHVVVMNDSIRVAISENAALEIGPDSRVQSQDKVEDVPANGEGGGTRRAAMLSLAAVPTVPYVSVSVGTIGAQLFDNWGAGLELGETNHCGVLGGASKSFDLGATETAVMVVDTVGSTIDTVLAVYKRVGLLELANNFVGCDDNSAPDGIRSRVRFEAQAEQVYRAYVDGVNGAQGEIRLNWRLGHGPVLTSTPTNITVRAGQSVLLRAEATNATHYQWLRNGEIVPGATNATLELAGVTAAQCGTYSAWVENEFDGTNGVVAEVRLPLLSVEPVRADGILRIWLPGGLAEAVELEMGDDLSSPTAPWVHLYTHLPMAPETHVDLPTTNAHSFVRARWAP